MKSAIVSAIVWGIGIVIGAAVAVVILRNVFHFSF